jgi:hypothetical protein
MFVLPVQLACSRQFCVGGFVVCVSSVKGCSGCWGAFWVEVGWGGVMRVLGGH